MIRQLLLALVVVLFQAVVCGQDNAAPAETDRIRTLIDTYAHAVDTADIALVEKIWSHSLEVSFIHPLGHERGLDQVDNFFRHVMGGTFSERKLTVHDLSIHVMDDAAWSEFYWDFAAKLRQDGSAETTKGRETQIYRKELGKWRLVHVHYSGMPVTDQRSGF